MIGPLWHPKPAPTYERQSGHCRAPGCGNTKLIALGLCWRHYRQQRRNGGKFIDPQRERGYAGPRPVCRVAGCGRPVPTAYKAQNEGLCKLHRVRLKHGVPFDLPPKADNSGFCKAEGCGRNARCRGYCGRHDMHLRRFGEIRPDGGQCKGRLPKAQWRQIERRLKAGESGAALAREFGITSAAVYMHMKKRRKG